MPRPHRKNTWERPRVFASDVTSDVPPDPAPVPVPYSWPYSSFCSCFQNQVQAKTRSSRLSGNLLCCRRTLQPLHLVSAAFN